MLERRAPAFRCSWFLASSAIACVGCVDDAPTADAPWSKPIAHTNSPAEAHIDLGLGVASSRRGHAVVMWSMQTGEDRIQDGVRQTFAMVYQKGRWSWPEAISEKVAPPHFLTAAMNGSGNVVAIWPQEMAATRYSAASGRWEPDATLVGPADSATHTDLKIGLADDGDAIAVWVADERFVRSARYSAGSWQPAIDLYESTTGKVHVDWFTVNARGDALAVWTAAQTFAAQLSGGAWTSPHAFEQVDVYSLSAALDDLGTALLASSVQDGAGRNLFQTYLLRDGVWSDAGSPLTTDMDRQELLLAADDRGTFWGGWTDDRSNPTPTLSRLDTSGTWEPPLKLTTPGTTGSSLSSYFKKLTSLSTDRESGRPMAMWTEGLVVPWNPDTFTNKAFTRELLSDGNWSLPTKAAEVKGRIPNAYLTKTGPNRAVAAYLFEFQDLDSVSSNDFVWTNQYN